MLDKTTWQFINSFAPWLSAIGTILVVIVALYLARRDRKIQFSVYARKIEIGNLQQNSWPSYITIDITNVGHRTATLSHIYWRTGIFKKGFYQQILLPDKISTEIPKKLNDGDIASYKLPLEGFRENLYNIKKGFRTNCLKLEIMFIFIVAVTTTGHKFKTRISKNLREWFLSNINNLDASNHKC